MQSTWQCAVYSEEREYTGLDSYGSRGRHGTLWQRASPTLLLSALSILTYSNKPIYSTPNPLTRVAVAYELTYSTNPLKAQNITNFLKDYLYKSEFYHFYNQTINVPYPDTIFLYGKYDSILDYGEGQDYKHVVSNLFQQLNISKSHQENGPVIADALSYIYNWRNPEDSPAALIIIGNSDMDVDHSDTEYWLNLFEQEKNITRMAVSFGGNLTSLTSDPSKYYFKVDGNDPNSQKSIADKLAKLIGAL